VGADDYYELLGIASDADPATLRQAWRRLAERWHPDRAGPDTTFVFQKLSAAYEVLADPVTRAAYDRKHGIAKPAPAPEPTPPARRKAPGTLLTRISRNLDILLAMGGARRADDGLIELFLDDEESTHGGMVTISMRVPVRCPACTSGCASCGSTGAIDELFAAWLAVPPEVEDGTVLHPSVNLPGMLEPVAFRVRIGG